MSVPLPHVRVATEGDLDGLYRLASAGGVGLTNLPADRPALAKRLGASVAAVESAAGRDSGAAILLVTEDAGAIVGTGCIFARVGADWPFFSYRLTRQAKRSQALGKTVVQTLLNPVNDFDGETEIGGLLIDPARRGGRLGALTARARYLFVAQHRDWFRSRVIAELRGYQAADGSAPVWEALGRHFYEMDFDAADRINAVAGNQFIADLGPRYPIYVSLLPEAARAALGKPHDDGRRAYAMLLAEGFRIDGYVDIFDGGPTLVADIDTLRTVSHAQPVTVADGNAGDGAADHLVCAGQAGAFRAAVGPAVVGDGGVRLGAELTATLAAVPGDPVRAVKL